MGDYHFVGAAVNTTSRISLLVVVMLASALSPYTHIPGGIVFAHGEEPATDREYAVDSLEFYVLANTQFALFHELGHALIHTLNLPVLGREEDAADTLAIAGLLIGEIERFQQDLLERLIVISDEWLLEWNESENQSAFWDSHSLEIQRFYTIVLFRTNGRAQKPMLRM